MLALAACIMGANADAALVGDPPTQWVDDEFVVYLHSGYSQATVDSICNRFCCVSHTEIADSLYLYVLPPDSDEQAAVDECNGLGLPDVIAAALHIVGYVGFPELETAKTLPSALTFSCAGVTDPRADEQWYLVDEQLNVCRIWELTKGADDSLFVVILDTGIDVAHPEFYADMGGRIKTVNFVESHEPSIQDTFGHGTKMAGIIGAIQNNNQGITGIAPEAHLIIGKIGYMAGTSLIMLPETFNDALRYVAQLANNHPLRRYVVNCSFGWQVHNNDELVRRMREAMEPLTYYHNVLVVAATGNDNYWVEGHYHVGYVAYPAAFSGESGPNYRESLDNIVVAAGATTVGQPNPTNPEECRVRPASYSSWAASDTCEVIVDVCAPGGGNGFNILTTTPVGHGYTAINGTSPAAACVTAAAALVWASVPELTAEQVKECLRAWAKRTAWRDPIWFVGLHRFHPFVSGYEAHCPQPSGYEEQPVWPGNGQHKGNGGFDFDSFCSVALGSGMANPAAMIEYSGARRVYRIAGGVMTESVDCNNADVLLTYGDLTIPDGITLSVSPNGQNQTVTFAMNDHDFQAAGQDASRVELVVQSGGTLYTDGAHIIMRPYKFAVQDTCWVGLTVDSGGAYGNPQAPRDLMILGSVSGLTLSGSGGGIAALRSEGWDQALAVSGTTSLPSIELTSRGVGCRLLDGASLQLTGATASSIDPLAGSGTTGVQFEGDAILSVAESLAISAMDEGMVVTQDGTGELAGGTITVDGCGVGLRCEPDGTFTLSSGALTVDGSGQGVGVALGPSSAATATGTATARHCNYGVLAYLADSADLAGNWTVLDNLIHGVLVDSCTGVTLSSAQNALWVEGSAQDGLRLRAATAGLNNVVFYDNDGNGIGCHEGSVLTARHTHTEANDTGIFFDGTSYGELGTLGVEFGYNTFKANRYYDCASLNLSTQTHADGNDWWSRGAYRCPPAVGRVLGWISTYCR